MSKTLKLADRVLARGRNLHELGRRVDALRTLDRLAGWRQLPGHVAEEMQARLAKIHLEYSQYAQARRHLAALVAHRPDNPQYHYMLARALDTHEEVHEQAAYEHYQRSLELDPRQADCLSDFGLLALRLEKPEEGLQAIRQAAELAPDDADVIGKLIEGLHRRGHLEEARITLRAALFRNPRSHAFEKLWSDFRFQQACEAQQATRQRGEASDPSEEPVLLPFLRLADDGAHKARRRPRAGLALPVASLLTPRPTLVPDRKRA